MSRNNNTNNIFTIYQHNINGFHSKQYQLEQVLFYNQPHICLLQECFRSSKNFTNFTFNHMYTWSFSETGRACILSRSDINFQQHKINNVPNKFELFGYESCWIQVSIPQRPSVMFCSIYRRPGRESDFVEQFEKEIILAKNTTSQIIVGGDFNSHNPAWGDTKTGAVGFKMLDCMIPNNLMQLNQNQQEPTFVSGTSSSFMDLTLCCCKLKKMIPQGRFGIINTSSI